MSISGSIVHSPVIQLQFLKSLLFTDICNLFPVSIYVAFRSAHPDDATMEDVKKALIDNNIDFSQLKEWNPDRCRQLLVGLRTPDEYRIG
jgi:hypothetical protein